MESISLYNDIIGDAKTRNMTKAYLRDHFLNNLDEGLPTYSANKRTYKNKEHVFKTIFSPEEQEMADKIHEYLKNRHKGTSKLAAIGSPTSGRSYTKKEITDYLGEKTHTPYTALGDLPIIRKLPFIPKRLKGITVPNKNYEILEQALTDPLYARELLTRQPVTYNTLDRHIPSLLSIMNNRESNRF